ncbi:hypothetical protein B0G57_1405 [Trinickia symbiotica]|nr:hypothetical protein B0G57_1405 [Trinickia symbiotica]
MLDLEDRLKETMRIVVKTLGENGIKCNKACGNIGQPAGIALLGGVAAGAPKASGGAREFRRAPTGEKDGVPSGAPILALDGSRESDVLAVGSDPNETLPLLLAFY